DGSVADWDLPPLETGIRVFDEFVPALARMFDRARARSIQTFGYAEHSASTVWLATSTGLRRRHGSRIGKVEITAKTPDFSRWAWTGTTTRDSSNVHAATLFEMLEQRLAWSRTKTDLPAGHYDVLLEPSCTADLALGAYSFMNRRDADEGRSPYSKP